MVSTRKQGPITKKFRELVDLRDKDAFSDSWDKTLKLMDGSLQEARKSYMALARTAHNASPSNRQPLAAIRAHRVLATPAEAKLHQTALLTQALHQTLRRKAPLSTRLLASAMSAAGSGAHRYAPSLQDDLPEMILSGLNDLALMLEHPVFVWPQEFRHRKVKPATQHTTAGVIILSNTEGFAHVAHKKPEIRGWIFDASPSIPAFLICSPRSAIVGSDSNPKRFADFLATGIPAAAGAAINADPGAFVARDEFARDTPAR